MLITKKESDALKKYLPSFYIEPIQAKLKEQGVIISDSLVEKVINAKASDNYGIITIALTIAEEKKKIEEKSKKMLNKL